MKLSAILKSFENKCEGWGFWNEFLKNDHGKSKNTMLESVNTGEKTYTKSLTIVNRYWTFVVSNIVLKSEYTKEWCFQKWGPK